MIKVAQIFDLFNIEGKVETMGQKWELSWTQNCLSISFFTKNKSVFLTFGQFPLTIVLNLRFVFLKTEE